MIESTTGRHGTQLLRAKAKPSKSQPHPQGETSRDVAEPEGPSAIQHHEEELLTCSICLLELEEREDSTTLHCKHQFHAGCIEAWLAVSNPCPLCQAEIPQPDLLPPQEDDDSDWEDINDDEDDIDDDEDDNNGGLLVELLQHVQCLPQHQLHGVFQPAQEVVEMKMEAGNTSNHSYLPQVTAQERCRSSVWKIPDKWATLTVGDRRTFLIIPQYSIVSSHCTPL